MFAVLFEVRPSSDQWEAYLGNAKMLRPELEQIDGFVDNIRYRSLARAGWILSLSSWRDEKSLVRWRTRANHHAVQEKGRREILLDYHLRVGQITADTCLPQGYALREQRLDETEVGEATTATLIDAHRPTGEIEQTSHEALADQLGFPSDARNECAAWDIFDAVLSPGDIILLASWRGADDARRFAKAFDAGEARFRQIRIIRDYGMFDRREAPQYYPDVGRRDA
jgi:heme-degrading monooxygenase HmoA